MKHLKVVQIGIGHDHAMPILNTLLGMGEMYEVAGLIPTEEDRRDFPDRIDLMAKKTAILTMDDLNRIRPEAVIVETEDEYLTKYAQLAADKGYPLHMDKPGAPDLAAFEKLIQTVKAKQLPFHTGYMYRYNPVVMQTLAKIKQGELGEIYSIEAHMNCLHNREKRAWLGKYKGGMTFYLGCHLIDIIYSVLGEPQEVIPLNACSHFDGVESEDVGFVAFRYPNGVSFIKTSAVEAGGFTRRQIVFCGQRGTVEIRPTEECESDLVLMHTRFREVYNTDNDIEGWPTNGKSGCSETFDRYESMMADFAAIVRHERQNACSYDYELGLFRLIQKAIGA